MQPPPSLARGPSLLQRISLSLMAVLVLLTFVGANLHAILWQSSKWLVSTVLPAVVVELTNEERSINHAAPLKRSAVLDQAAKLKAEDMAKHEYFAHFSPTGVTPWHWFDEAGYVYAHAGENLAIHFTDSAEVVEAWMDSPLHRQNIVDTRFTEIGVGTAKGTYEGYDTVYVVQLFGTPAVPSAPPAAATPPLARAPAPDPILTLPPATTPKPAPLAVETSETEVSAPLVSQSERPTSSVVVATEPVVIAPPSASSSEDQASQIMSSEPVPDSEPIVTAPLLSAAPSSPEEVVVVETNFLATSSGLAVANITTTNSTTHAGATLAIVTQPNRLLQTTYTLIATIVLLLLGSSVLLGARRLQFKQVAYGLLLMLIMSGLWYTHALLTGGAVVA